MIFDPMYIVFVGPGLLLALWATWRVKSTFAKFSQVGIASRKSGAEVAAELLERSGIRDVRVELHEGFLSDHYHPGEKVVRLSPDVYHGRSISAVGVAAHEVGHAIQHQQKYAAMALRQSMVLPANIGTYGSYIVIVIGFLVQQTGLIWLGIALFGLVVLFQLVTLPVEFNASTRAKHQLVATGIVGREEGQAVAKVLNAAAMTYVAALITSILTLLYYIYRFTGSRR